MRKAQESPYKVEWTQLVLVLLACEKCGRKVEKHIDAKLLKRGRKRMPWACKGCMKRLKVPQMRLAQVLEKPLMPGFEQHWATLVVDAEKVADAEKVKK